MRAENCAKRRFRSRPVAVAGDYQRISFYTYAFVGFHLCLPPLCAGKSVDKAVGKTKAFGTSFSLKWEEETGSSFTFLNFGLVQRGENFCCLSREARLYPRTLQGQK